MAEKKKPFRPSDPPYPQGGPYQNPPPRKGRDDEPTGNIKTPPPPKESGMIPVVRPPETKKLKP